MIMLLWYHQFYIQKDIHYLRYLKQNMWEVFAVMKESKVSEETSVVKKKGHSGVWNLVYLCSLNANFFCIIIILLA